MDIHYILLLKGLPVKKNTKHEDGIREHSSHYNTSVQINMIKPQLQIITHIIEKNKESHHHPRLDYKTDCSLC